jgi:hypothetical protein
MQRNGLQNVYILKDCDVFINYSIVFYPKSFFHLIRIQNMLNTMVQQYKQILKILSFSVIQKLKLKLKLLKSDFIEESKTKINNSSTMFIMLTELHA